VSAGTIVLGVDCGTQGVRVLAVDAAGRTVGSARVGHETTFTPDGGAEQAPIAWWQGLVGALAALRAEGLDPAEVAAMAITSTSSTVVFADAAGRPVAPALLWMDVRAVAEARELGATGDAVLALCPDGVSPEWGPPKCLWLARHHPAAWTATAHIVEAADWLVHRATGVWTMNAAAATTAWFYDRRTGTWPSALLDAVGLADLERRLPARVTGLGEVVGPLLPPVAAELGLPAGLPVVCGGIDSVSAMVAAGVTRAGATALITGSSNVVLSLADHPVRARGVWGSYHGAAIAGLDLAVGLHNAGSVVTWLTRDLLGGATYEGLEAAALEVPAGSGGLVVLPDFQGNRTPFTEPLARGAIWGLRLDHGPAHLFRATLEGIACATRLAIAAFEAAGVAVANLRVCGGATRSPLAMRILADVLGREIGIIDNADASALGAAVSAAVAVGWFPDVAAGADAMSRVAGTVAPNPAHRAVYDDLFSRFRETYPALLPLMRRAGR